MMSWPTAEHQKFFLSSSLSHLCPEIMFQLGFQGFTQVLHCLNQCPGLKPGLQGFAWICHCLPDVLAYSLVTKLFSMFFNDSLTSWAISFRIVFKTLPKFFTVSPISSANPSPWTSRPYKFFTLWLMSWPNPSVSSSRLFQSSPLSHWYPVLVPQFDLQGFTLVLHCLTDVLS